MAIEEKIDLLIKETVALRQATEANTAALTANSGGGGGTAAAGDSDKPRRGRPPKAEVAPEHSAEEVEEKIRAVSKGVGRDHAVKLIKSFKCDDLAELLTHPEHFDAAYDKAVALLPSEEAEGEDDI